MYVSIKMQNDLIKDSIERQYENDKYCVAATSPFRGIIAQCFSCTIARFLLVLQ